MANLVTMLISGGTILSSLFSAWVINRIGTARTTVLSTALTAAALLGFSLSAGLVWLCLLALPLGIALGSEIKRDISEKISFFTADLMI